MPRPEFAVHMLNEDGKLKAQIIAARFEFLLVEMEAIIGPQGREMAIVRTKLEEGCFFAKKAMASQPQNQAPESAL